MKENQEVVINPFRLFIATLLPAILLTVFVMVNPSIAQMPPDIPIQFKIRGEFYDPEQNPEKGGVNSFTANVGNKQWILDIERADTLQGSMLGSSVLKKIYPPILTFVGPKELTGQLTNPEIAGKSYTMTGQLYVKKRMLRLNSVDSNEKEAEGEAASDSQGGSGSAPPASSPPAAPTHSEPSP